MRFIKEDTFTWASYDQSRRDVNCRNCAFQYTRRIFLDEETGFYFFKLNYQNYIFDYVGFVKEIENLHEESLLPVLDLELERDGRPLELSDKQFTTQCRALIKRYHSRNKQMRPVQSAARAKAREAAQAYWLLFGTICLVSTDRLKIVERDQRGPAIDCWMRMFLPGRYHGNWWCFDLQNVKDAGLWNLTPEEELDLTKRIAP